MYISLERLVYQVN